jgi:branched-chain amino acid transport system substrate-binding protein
VAPAASPAAAPASPIASLSASPAVAASPAASASSGAATDTLHFGAAISLSGSLAQEGALTREGYEIWKDTYNAAGGITVDGKKRKIAITYYDDESDAKKTATLVERLVTQDKVDFLLGPYGTSATLQAAAVAEKYRVPLVEGNGAAESIFNQGYTYTFGVLSPVRNYLRGVVDLTLTLSPRPATVAILSADDAFSLEVAEAAKSYAESKGLQVVSYQTYPNAATDLRVPLGEVTSKHPDLVLNSGHLAESIAIVQESREIGLSPKGFGFSVGPSIRAFYDTLQGDADGVMGGAQWTAELTYQGDDLFKTPKAYHDAYMAAFGHEPSYQSAESTASGIVFARAIEAANTLDHAAVRDAIARQSFTSFFGPITFDARGLNVDKPMAVEQWQGGKRLTVWPLDVANGQARWPMPAWSAR